MDHVHSLYDLDVMRRGIRAAARLHASDEFNTPKSGDDLRALRAGFEVFNDACLTALGALASAPGRDDPADWEAIVAGVLAAVEGVASMRPHATSARAVLAYTVANAYVLDALSQAAMGVAASALDAQ